ncbi:MAG: ABC transporter ATP-binding protein, partial [Firmicutes bacterium]|nr:ABC transporter ATP-binding protein [Candidatus Onthovivens merdipullorum]
MIIIEKIEKIFGNRKLFENLNVTFFEKGLYGITGESGTGKT